MSDNKVKDFTRGGQITFHNLRMLTQVNKTITKCYFSLMLVVFIGIIYMITPHDMLINAIKYIQAVVYHFLGRDNHILSLVWKGTIYPTRVTDALHNPYFYINIHAFLHRVLIALGISVALGVLLTWRMARWLVKRGRAQTDSQFVRGMKLGKVKDLAKTLRKDNMASDIHIDGMPLLRGSEVQHTLVHGTTGAGKGQLIMKVLDQLRERGDRVIIYDKGCAFTPLYYREETDTILNPFDERCANWDLWSEALEAADFENMAESLIPMHGSDPFWVNAPRTIFGSAAFTMQDDEDRSIMKLLKLLLVDDLSALHQYLKHTEAASLSDDKIEKTAQSLRTVLATYTKSLRFLSGLDKPGEKKFSIRNWVQDERNNGWLFISSNAIHHNALLPLISMWMSMASLALLSLPENYHRRIWFIVDELSTLQKMPQLAETIAEVRKFGGCFLLGMQSYAQLEKRYGPHAAREMFDLLNTRFFFRSTSANMAKLVSEELGEQDVEEVKENYSYGANTVRDGISIGRQRTTRRLVSHPEIMGLENLNCYLRLPGHYDVVPLSLKYQKRKERAAHLLLRDMNADPDLEVAIDASGTHTANKTSKVEEERSDTKVSSPLPIASADAPAPASGANKPLEEKSKVLDSVLEEENINSSLVCKEGMRERAGLLTGEKER